jgi:hypothetical protein
MKRSLSLVATAVLVATVAVIAPASMASAAVAHTAMTMSAKWVNQTLSVSYGWDGPIEDEAVELTVDGKELTWLFFAEHNQVRTLTRAASAVPAKVQMLVTWCSQDPTLTDPADGCETDVVVSKTVSRQVATTTKKPVKATSKTVSAKTLISKLAVRAENHAHKYNRDQFDYPIDANHNGCNTRKEVLIQEHIGAIRISKSCAVYGTWKSFFDNRITHDAHSLEVDHLVPLAEAWYSGAYAWSALRKKAFGNDLGYKWSLNAVTTSANLAKKAKDPAEWMPKDNKCTYAKAWIGVKYRWHLSVDPREKAALVRYLGTCRSLQVLRPGTPNLKVLA